MMVVLLMKQVMNLLIQEGLQTTDTQKEKVQDKIVQDYVEI